MQKEKIDESKKGFFSTLERIKQQKLERQRPLTMQPEIKLTGPILESIPNINEIVNQKRFQPHYQPSFEEMMDNHIRKMSSKFTASENEKISLEEELMRYAQEFKEKVQARENLKKNIDMYIKENRKKLDEFFQWNEQEMDKRHDAKQCFFDYVKKKLKESGIWRWVERLFILKMDPEVVVVYKTKKKRDFGD